MHGRITATVLTVALPALLAVFGGCAHTGGGAKPEAIPVPLASALLPDQMINGARTNAVFVVGAVPSGYPASLVPSGPARIVGGMTTTNEMIVVFADSTRRLAAVMEDVFQAAGFHRPAPSLGSGFFGGSGAYRFFCKDGATVLSEPLTGSERTFVRVTYRGPRGISTCANYSASSYPAAPTPTVPKYLEFPALKPMPGAQVLRSGSSAGSEGVGATAEMTGSGLVTGAVLAHYAEQLVSAGWVAAAPAISDKVSAQFFEAKDASGAPWEGVLMVVGGGHSASLSLDMHHRRRQ